MADEYIRREDAVKRLDPYRRFEIIQDAIDYIESLEPADVAPVVHSRWEYKCGEIRCPECGNRICRIDLSGCLNFCPNCGAKMDREE